MGRFQLELIYLTSTPSRPVDNVVIATKGLQDRNIHILDGTTVENKGKLILTEFYSVDSFLSMWFFSQTQFILDSFTPCPCVDTSLEIMFLL